MEIQSVETESEKERNSVIAGSMGKNHVIFGIDAVMVHPQTVVVEDADFLIMLEVLKSILTKDAG